MSGIKPVSLVACCGLVVPREEVVMTVSEGGSMTHTVLAGNRVWPDKLTLGSGHRHQREEDKTCAKHDCSLISSSLSVVVVLAVSRLRLITADLGPCLRRYSGQRGAE